MKKMITLVFIMSFFGLQVQSNWNTAMRRGLDYFEQGNFIDSNAFSGIVYNDQINYPIIGKRKKQTQEDKEFTSSVFQGFIQFIKAFFNR